MAKVDIEESVTVVDTLLKQASICKDAGDAMKFTQAALNAANAIRVLRSD